MEPFTVRDLSDRTGELIQGAEAGRLALVTKHGRPVFVAVPLDQKMLEQGLQLSLAVRLRTGERDRVLRCAASSRTCGGYAIAMRTLPSGKRSDLVRGRHDSPSSARALAQAALVVACQAGGYAVQIFGQVDGRAHQRTMMIEAS